jgi:hypothetical protein
MAADLPGVRNTLSDVARRLAGYYREAAIWRQLAILAIPLLVMVLSESTWLLGAAILLLGILFWLRPELGLLLIAFTLPFAFVYKRIGADIVSTVEMLTLVCFVAWGASRLRRPAQVNWRASRAANAIDLGVIWFVAAALASLISAEDVDAARWELRILVIEPALLYLMVRCLARPRRHSELSPTAVAPSEAEQGDRAELLCLVDAWAAGATVVALIGLYQYFFTDYVEAVQGVRRILGIYDSPNHVSLYIGRIVPVSLCLAAFGATRWRRIAHGLALLPLLSCLYLTYSRGAWLLGLPSALVFIGIVRGGWVRAAAVAATAAALLALAPILRTPRIASLLTLEGGTNLARILLWRGALRMLADHVLLGVGLSNFMRQYPRYMLREAGHEPVVYHPHNLLLDTWLSLGIAGVAAMAWILVAFFLTGRRLYRALAREVDNQALVLGLMASMVSFFAHGLVDTGWRLTDLAFVFMLTLGIISGLSATARPRPR